MIVSFVKNGKGFGRMYVEIKFEKKEGNYG